jgi:glycosyltransferase involved in cell wall biosynthesis
MKKLLFRAPVQTASGYGVHSRMLLRALDKSGLFDITVMSVPWGGTPLIYDDTPEMRRITELANKFNPAAMRPEQFDGSVQVTIPNEFMKLAQKNVCVTAGIETDRVPALWQQKCNEIADLVVVPSVHSARSFTLGIYGGERGPEQLRLKRPLYILPEWVDTDVFNTGPLKELCGWHQFPARFNFISVGLGLDKLDGGERKNFTSLIKWFCEQFKGSQEVGLVLKLSMMNSSPVDFKGTQERIRMLKQQAGCGEFPRIHLIHGRLSDTQMVALYKHPRISAFVSLTHGEGFGLPMIEAAACGLPVIATEWSGHLDFLRKDGRNLFVPVEYDLKPIPPSAVWKDVLDEGTRWAEPREADAKMKMAKVVLSPEKPREWAAELAQRVANTFNEHVADGWIRDIHDLFDGKRRRLTKNTLVQTAPSTRVLKNLTLVSIDTRPPMTATHDAVFVARKTMEQIGFARKMAFVSDEYPISSRYPPPDDLEVAYIKPFLGVPDYERFVMKVLPDYIETDFFLSIQPDGYMLNGSAWDDRFLEYDYIGAPWFWNGTVGNGAFCIRSKRLALELQKPEYEPSPMDTNTCVKYRAQLEAKGFKFAPVELAACFSVENLPYEGQLGWHGDNPFNGEKVVE